ncbi:stage II sporulation protein P [Alkalibaculum bacchi]|uniref:Stage II sporulation protein P n=1 Tax=Alkalibaculum bacchi TaxID=645887 RepID=A0A366I797_9FIRM|nr:stage II sporulation protein P [Alkalibaculum bacchi]RBP63890.1 stage II sporulation protein P [Alkalibaculum bacchi]
MQNLHKLLANNKAYKIIVAILLISIVLQLGLLITNLIKGKQEVQVDANVTTVKGVSKDLENTEEKNVKKCEDEKISSNLFTFLLQQVIPYQKDPVDYGVVDAIKDLTQIDISDPKILISSQIPIMDSYEVDDVEITEEEEEEIYNLTSSKPLNDGAVAVNNTGDKPLVLLYATHTTESYASSSKTKINYVSYARSLDERYNMVAVCQEIKKVLEDKYGVQVVLDTTIHDHPDYNSSYSNSLETIKKNLQKYPSIKYVFDIHRDGLAENQKNKEVYATAVNGVNSTRVMMVVGLNHQNSANNAKFSDQVYGTFNEMYPSLTRPSVKRSKAKYNQFVSDNAVLFEIGSNLSTLEEAKVSASHLGDVLGKVITEKETN